MDNVRCGDDSDRNKVETSRPIVYYSSFILKRSTAFSTNETTTANEREREFPMAKAWNIGIMKFNYIFSPAVAFRCFAGHFNCDSRWINYGKSRERRLHFTSSQIKRIKGNEPSSNKTLNDFAQMMLSAVLDKINSRVSLSPPSFFHPIAIIYF